MPHNFKINIDEIIGYRLKHSKICFRSCASFAGTIDYPTTKNVLKPDTLLRNGKSNFSRILSQLSLTTPVSASVLKVTTPFARVFRSKRRTNKPISLQDYTTMISRRTFSRSWTQIDYYLGQSTYTSRTPFSSQAVTEVPASSNTDPLSIDEVLSSQSLPVSFNTVSHSHRKSFVRWIETKGKQYQAPNNSFSTNYLDDKPHPFPLNPQFQPQPPLPQDVKTTIYADWQSGIGLRQLSQTYGISLERVEAVLKLEEVGQQWTSEVSRNARSGEPLFDDAINSISL